MDLLYSRYASPMDLMKIYIEQGRFGEFVEEILEMEMKRKKAEAEKDSDNKLWIAFVHSKSDKTFSEWKEDLKQKEEPKNYSMNDKQVEEVKQKSKGILKGFQPK